MNEENLYVHALKLTPGIGDVLAKQLISYCGSATAIYKEKKGTLLKIPSIGKKTIASIFSTEFLTRSEKTISECLKENISILPYYHEDYPEKLKLVSDAPLLIYKKGEVSFSNRKIVAIVGTRNATEYGKDIVSKIVKDLVAHNAVIASGLAYGIDITAHRMALKGDLPTVAVLAGGLDRIYPALHKNVAEEMLNNGGWVSEQMPGVKSEPHFFPARNRIIAGMSDALIVVEAASKGGALITANIAYSYNREVFAVPGDLANTYSVGCNSLIRAQKANIYTGVKDLEYLMGWEKGEEPKKEKKVDLSILTDGEQKLVKVLSQFESGLQLDELSWKSQISINETVSMLLNLEFSGLVKSLPGKKYVLL